MHRPLLAVLSAALAVFAGVLGVSPAAVAQTPGGAGTPVGTFVRPDGTLDLAGAPAGALDLAGLNVTMGADGALRAAGEGDFTDISSGPTGAALGDVVHAVAVAPDGTVYVGGEFARAGSPVQNRVARRAVGATAWEALGAGVSGPVYALSVASDGSVYAGGTLLAAGGAVASHVARWTGTAWEPLGAGVDRPVSALAVDTRGDIVLGGSFTTAGPVYSPFVTLYDAPGTVAAEDGAEEVDRVGLAVAPNPVSTGGTVRVWLQEAGPVRVAVYDVLGRQVAILAEGERSSGTHDVSLDAGRLTPGVYVVRLTAGASTVVRRVTVAR